MIKKQNLILMTFAAGLLTFSCSQEDPWSNYRGGQGSLEIKLSSTGQVSSAMPNVRAVSSEIITPPSESFNIKLTSKDGSFSKTWSSIKEFEEEHEFDAGLYSLEAIYGSEDSQGIVSEDEDGHEHAYYYGLEEDIEIKPGETTSVQLQAGLANSIVVVEYTDAFKNYFKDWSTTLQTTGKSVLSLENAEGMAYVVPGNVDIIIKATLQNGKSVTMNPTVFEALPCYMYKIRYNINNGDIGQADKLEITFNDDPEETHKIIVELTEELLNSEGPVVTLDVDNPEAEGLFIPSETILEVLEGNTFNGNVKYTISALGGIAEAILSVKTDDPNFHPSFLSNGVIDLCNTSSIRSQLENAGIRTLGLAENPDKMAQVDITEFCKTLPVGKTEISLTIKDKATRVNEPVTVNFSIVPLNMRSRVENSAWFLDGYGEVIITYNGAEPTSTSPFSFKVQNDFGFVDAEILSIQKLPSTRSFEDVDYLYRIKMPAASRIEFPVKVCFNGIERESMKTSINMEYPEYHVEFDPTGSVIRMRVDEYRDKTGTWTNITADKNMLNRFADILQITIDDQKILTQNIIKSTEGIISIKGYNPGTEHIIETSITPIEGGFTTKNKISMETAVQLNNSDFSQIDDSRSIHMNKINIGGQYKVAVGLITRDYQNFSSIERNVPSGWANINDWTCYQGSSVINTWFQTPSTFIENNACVIRTVGYHHSGVVPATSGNQFNTNYYCENAPTSLNIGVGELFLGTYSFNGNESRTNGVSFNTRPAGISIDYSYTSYQQEFGEAYIKVYNGNKLIGQGSTDLTESSSLTNKVITLTDYAFGEKATRLEVGFKSTATSLSPSIKIPEGTDLKEDGITWNNFTQESARTIPANQYKAFAMGSELKLFNVKLIY